MHHGFFPWWRHRYAGCGPSAYAGAAWFGHRRPPEGGGDDDPSGFSGFGGFAGGPFGVRRPLRFLAYKLGLTEEQVEELAAILDDLKTERAQAAVDHRRMTSTVADLLAASSFDEAKAAEARGTRVKSAERLADIQGRALKRVHALLNDEQRKTFAYLLRTGVIAI